MKLRCDVISANISIIIELLTLEFTIDNQVSANTTLQSRPWNENDRLHFWPTVLSVVPLARCVVCLSVTFCIAAKRYVLAKKCLKE